MCWYDTARIVAAAQASPLLIRRVPSRYAIATDAIPNRHAGSASAHEDSPKLWSDEMREDAVQRMDVDVGEVHEDFQSGLRADSTSVTISSYQSPEPSPANLRIAETMSVAASARGQNFAPDPSGRRPSLVPRRILRPASPTPSAAGK
jgi:hypothetical protein